jgi:hypothetical protein
VISSGLLKGWASCRLRHNYYDIQVTNI